MLEFLAVLAVLAVAVWVIVGPLREGPGAAEQRVDAEIGVLETAKAAKYAEIRDAELEFRTGKLSEQDWKGLDRQLRGEAVAILRRLDALGVQDEPEDR